MIQPTDHPLFAAADAAISDLFSDTSVSQEVTLAALEELAADIDSRIDALRADLGTDH